MRSFFKLAPYLCGVLYGFFGGLAAGATLHALSIFALGGIKKYPRLSPALGFAMLFACLMFFCVLLLNILVFKKTKRTLASIIFEVLFPLVSFLPFTYLSIKLISFIIDFFRSLNIP